ncbi:MAG: hypothetical protein E3J64_02195 [Anaerolineales bacterium]|nr:MAG: hypothetical protein E3J64_02195 [Anaerolineales bacterium]
MRTSGWVVFASIMLVMAGMFGIIHGLVALLNDEVYLVTKEGVVAFDFTTWGWIHLILGIIVFIAGFAVMSGQLWARIVGVFVAMLSAVSQIAFITAFPLWSVVIIGIDVLIIYGLLVHGEEVEEA